MYIVPLKNLNDFNLCIARSTCILNEAMLFDCFISFDVKNLPFPLPIHCLVNGGMFKQAPRLRSRSFIKKPLSAITWSSRSIKSKNPLFSVMHLSDVFPDHNSDTNEKAPLGCHAYKCLKCILVFIVRPSFTLSRRISGALNIKLCCINNYSCLWVFQSESQWHMFHDFLTRRPF